MDEAYLARNAAYMAAMEEAIERLKAEGMRGRPRLSRRDKIRTLALETIKQIASRVPLKSIFKII